MRHGGIAALALAVAACSAGQPGSDDLARTSLLTYIDEACAPSGREAPTDQTWLQGALAGWRMLEADVFQLTPPAQSPDFVLFDASCVYRSGDGENWTAALHNGAIVLPDGASVEPGVMSFSSAGESGHPFMVMALPSVWQAQGVPDRGDMAAFLTAVFVHEMTHTRQASALGARIDAAVPADVAADVSDDMVQHRFGENADFEVAILGEIDELRAGAAGHDEAARLAAGKVLAGIGMRQQAWYGSEPWLAEVEDVFLAMEGAGQYASYAWLIDEKGGGRTPEQAHEMLKTRWWTQEEGLALMILVTRLVPDWRERVFGPQPQTASDLLTAAAG